MLALAGLPLGYRFSFIDPAADACAAALGQLKQASYEDPEALRQFTAEVDVATFDFENVSGRAARRVAAVKPFYPPVEALEICQDRLTERQLLNELGIDAPGFRPVSSRPELMAACEQWGFPCVLKTRRMGYDGKGQAILRQAEDLERAWQRLGQNDLILEPFVPFVAECSMLAVRGLCADIRFWPLTRNLHLDGVLLISQPGVLDQGLQHQAQQLAARLLEHLDYVGVMAIEFFIHGGRLLVNEIAPRVHNSGHWTIDAAVTSQFENHIRAITGLPLGDTSPTACSLMFNWLGNLPKRQTVLAVPGVHWHDYGKSPRPGRKLGHATLTAADPETLLQRARQLVDLLGGAWPASLAACRPL